MFCIIFRNWLDEKILHMGLFLNRCGESCLFNNNAITCVKNIREYAFI